MSAAFRPIRLSCVRALLGAVLVLVLPSAAAAQYFGVNKVQYRALHFRVLETEHFDIYFQHDQKEPVEAAARLAERWWARLSQFFGHAPARRQPLVFYRSQVDFEQTPIIPDTLDLGTRGLIEPWRRRILMPVAGPLAETDHILGHELVHAFQLDIGSRPPPRGIERTDEPLPRWFIEGLAEYLSRGDIDTHTAMWLRDAARFGDLPSLHALEHRRYFPYPWGHAFWAFVAQRWSDTEAASLFTVASMAGVTAAIERVLGLTPDQFVHTWHTAIRAAHQVRPEDVAPAGWPVLAGRAIGHATNVGPAISPDGKWLAFLSERLFSVDLFVADVTEGDVVAQLTDTAEDPHDRSAQFTDSAGAWDRKGERLAVAMVTAGRAAISVFSWPGGIRELDVVFDELEEIYSPTWSPDGRSVAFTGTSGGLTDLFVYDLQRATLRRLTNDVFADIQPAWEPDGRRIAFVTDRFTADRAAMTFGAYRLALIDVETTVIQPVTAFSTGQHTCPQWSPDGRSLYLISDWDGTPNLYRLDVATGAMQRLTAVITGVSGVTASSPALSVAARDGTVAFTIYERGRFSIYTLIPDDGKPVDTAQPSGSLEPDAAEANHVNGGWLADTRAASSRSDWPVTGYSPRLSLERLAQTAFSVGTDRFVAATGTGLGLVFSDLLNSHWVVTALDASRGFETGLGPSGTAAYGGYLNKVHRWNWGAIAGYVPSLTAAQSPGAALKRQTELSGTAVTTYALDRARRVEFTAGISHLTFDRIAGAESENGQWRPDPSPLTLGIASAAFVSDRTIAGPTSVLRGERYRVEVAPTFGGGPSLSVLADYRAYITPAPFWTIAARALHVARYGAGADDPRVPSLYLGRPTLVRGYGLSVDTARECIGSASARCEEIDALHGRRLAVGNIELRFPLLRPFGLSARTFGPLPLELAFFADAGFVWRTVGASPASSAGVTLRTNLFGLGVGQFDIARPLSKHRGWTVQFNLTPAL